MTDLVLHIGLPKTATSTIQSYLLAGRSTFMGKEKHNRCLPGTSQEVRKLLHLVESTLWESDSSIRSRANKWADRCGELLLHNFPQKKDQPNALVISEEKLTSWPLTPLSGSRWPITTGWRSKLNGPRIRPAPIIRLLQNHGTVLWPYGDIRILFTLRNQPDWLASHYSQLSSRIPNASQQDFEQRVEWLTKNGDPFLDWSAWIEDMEHVVSPTNIRALLMEEMGNTSFWNQLAEFLCLDNVATTNLASTSSPRKNVRRDITQECWWLRKLKVKKTLSQDMQTLGVSDSKLFKCIRKSEGFLLRPILRATMDRDRESQIHMKDDLRNRIIERLASANNKLASKIGYSIRPLGY